MSEGDWDYFSKDRHYSDVLKARLAEGVEMDSAKAMAGYMNKHFAGDLRVLDYGSGPAHYYPVLKRLYAKGALRYLGVDIDESNVRFGASYFNNDPDCRLAVGSVLEPEYINDDINCIISANTLPHVPTVVPLLRYLCEKQTIRFFVFRMLLGGECVQIKKHLREREFEEMYTRDFQYNNIYSQSFLSHHLGVSWSLSIEPDLFDAARLDNHRVPAQETDAFYANRVSRSVGGMVFKGDIYMPWKFVVGRRID
jgi:SAM-dependent methyltransferase